MKRIVFWLLAALAVAFLLIQFKTVERDDPPVEETIEAPPEVLALLRRSCFDCHSHETDWPWYGRIAPASWVVAEDVHHAREHLNFSTWNRYDPDERADLYEEIAEEVSAETMPLPLYLFGHPGARPTDAERERIVEWAAAAEEEAERAAEAMEEAAEAAEDGADQEDDSGRGRGRGRGRGSDQDDEHDHDDHGHDHGDHEH